MPHAQRAEKHISHRKRMFWPNSATTPSTSPRKRQVRLCLPPPPTHTQPPQHPHGAGFLPHTPLQRGRTPGRSQRRKHPHLWGSAMEYGHRNSDKTHFLPPGFAPCPSTAVIPTLACPKAEVKSTGKYPLNQKRPQASSITEHHRAPPPSWSSGVSSRVRRGRSGQPFAHQLLFARRNSRIKPAPRRARGGRARRIACRGELKHTPPV